MMSGLLASVCSVKEARLALAYGADIIDCKNPHEGALGALDAREIRLIVMNIAGLRPVSATIGDVHNPDVLGEAIQAVSATGVDFIKVGLFDEQHAEHCLEVLADCSGKHRLIAVCFADRFDPTPLLGDMAARGLAGVMMDTADKAAGRLTEVWCERQCTNFVSQARNEGLICGLAGRLHLTDIAKLLPHGADYLGFRSALCGGNRKTHLRGNALRRVRNAMPRQEVTSNMPLIKGYRAVALS